MQLSMRPATTKHESSWNAMTRNPTCPLRPHLASPLHGVLQLKVEVVDRHSAIPRHSRGASGTPSWLIDAHWSPSIWPLPLRLCCVSILFSFHPSDQALSFVVWQHIPISQAAPAHERDRRPHLVKHPSFVLFRKPGMGVSECVAEERLRLQGQKRPQSEMAWNKAHTCVLYLVR